MTYINKLNRFWRLSSSMTLSAHAKLLYLYLLNASNAVGLKSTFKLSVSSILSGTELSPKQYRAAKSILAREGLVELEINQATHVATVKLCMEKLSDGFPQGRPNGYPNGNPNGNPNGYPNGYPNGHPKNSIHLNINRLDKIREYARKTYDVEAFAEAAFARGEGLSEG